MMENLKAVIYDLDDLMVNSNGLHVKASEVVLSKFGYSQDELPKDSGNRFVGMKVSEILEVMHSFFKLKIPLKDFEKERAEIFLELVKKELEIFPGVIESLNFFKKEGFKIALASSGTKEYIKAVFDKFGLEKYFDIVVSGDQVKKGKPDPQIFSLACQKLEVEPDEAVVLEDATVGIESAKGAGCVCIAIKNSYTPKQDLSKADLVLDSIKEINRQILEKLTK